MILTEAINLNEPFDAATMTWFPGLNTLLDKHLQVLNNPSKKKKKKSSLFLFSL
jgi:hypothetical protein